jgi:hypothetical protein
MHSLNFKLRYRPIRIGWCVRAGDFASLRQSIRTSLTLCGGANNPLVVVDEPESAARLIASSHVDLLLAVREDAEITKFTERFPHLPKWDDYRSVFENGPGGTEPSFLDVATSTGDLVSSLPSYDTTQPKLHLYSWPDNDALADVFLATFGGLPRTDEPGDFMLQHLHLLLEIEEKPAEDGLSPRAIPRRIWTLRRLAERALQFDLFDRRLVNPSGFFIGKAEDFWALVNYWNLRAAGCQLLFYDPQLHERLEPVRTQWAVALNSRAAATPEAALAHVVYGIASDLADAAGWLPDHIDRQTLAALDRHVETQTRLRYYEEHDVLANVGVVRGRQPAAMPLPPLPFRTPKFAARNLALTVGLNWDPRDDDRSTFQVPDLPVMNTYYGRQTYGEWNAVRVERRGLAILQRFHPGSLTLNALDVVSLIREMLKRLGIPTEISQAGLVTARVIAQMGGLDGCRPFRVRGLRALIERTRPEANFTRPGAIQAIREEVNGVVGFDRYTDLHIEPPPAALSPESVFKYMVSRGAFRVGLEFRCTECSLEFWTSLDSAAANPECEFCGKRFDATPQLRDRDWRYRRSGVFGKSDSQEGAIPVALTLFRFMHMGVGKRMLYSPALKLLASEALTNECETDFVALITVDNFRRSGFQLVVGECKTRQEITEQDVTNLVAVADALLAKGIDVYVVFAKLVDFTDAELIRIAGANAGGYTRTIVLTHKELEHWLPYKWAEAPGVRRFTGFSLEDFAQASDVLYFAPAANRAAAH